MTLTELGETNHLQMVTEEVRLKGHGALVRFNYKEVIMDEHFFTNPRGVGICYGLAPSVVTAKIGLEDGILAISEPVEITSRTEPWIAMVLSSLEMKAVDPRVVRELLDYRYLPSNSYTLQDGRRLSDPTISLEGRATDASDLMFSLYTHDTVPPTLKEWITSGKLWQATKERQDFGGLPIKEEVYGLIQIAHGHYARLAERGLHVVSVSGSGIHRHVEKDHTPIFQRPFAFRN